MQRITPAEVSRAMDAARAQLGNIILNEDKLIPVGLFHAKLTNPVAHMEAEFRELRQRLTLAYSLKNYELAAKLEDELAKIPQELVMKDDYLNLVVTTGRNDCLDKWLAGSAYTAAMYLGLISAASYTTGVVAADTMASHAGWTEFVGYSNTNRPTAAWSTASAGTKALSAGLVFNINATGTVKGSFMTTNNSKGGTTGILASGGLFSGGDQPVVDTNTLTVNYSLSLTAS